MSEQDMTEHPCNGMTKAQIATFERVAINMPPTATMKTILALIERGLIVKTEHVIGRDALGDIAINEYHVPLPIHAQWCEWCSEQPGIDDVL